MLVLLAARGGGHLPCWICWPSAGGDTCRAGFVGRLRAETPTVLDLLTRRPAGGGVSLGCVARGRSLLPGGSLGPLPVVLSHAHAVAKNHGRTRSDRGA